MEYNQEQFFRMQQFDAPKMPFYMSYPMQNLYLTEMEYEKDMDRMKELYPRDVKKILDFVEDECDKMEYEGSLMFDEYPDRLMLERVIDRIYQNIKGQENSITAEQYWGGRNPLEERRGPGPGPGRPGGPPPPPPGRPGRPGGPPPPPPGRPGGPPPPPPGRPGDDFRNLIGVLLNNEMYRRRCRHRRCRRWW